MFPGPLFRREFRVATRWRHPFVFRSFVGLVLGGIILAIGLIVLVDERSPAAAPDLTRVRTFASVAFLAMSCMELAILVFIVPALAGGAIAEERERDTLSMLLLTRLSPAEIVLAKFAGRWVPVTGLLLTGLPLMFGSAWAAGLVGEAELTLLILVASSGFMAALSLMASAHREQAGTARAQATAWVFGWLLGPPILSILPAASGTLWGDLRVELKALGTLVAPSSPLSLVTDPGWYVRPWAVSLVDRVGLMVGLQGALSLLALAAAANRLKARETHPNWTDPTRGYRPPCADDPIYWREYELPTRRGGSPVVVLRLRYLWILVRAIVITLCSLLATVLVLAIPIGLAATTVYLGTAAFREVWQNGFDPQGPFEARGQFNLLVRASTGLLALLPVMGLPALIMGRITAERSKKTWEPLLTTPLDAVEILTSKARAMLHSFWQTAWPLLPVWGLGIACGAVSPWGVLFSALDVSVALWAAVALGLYLGVRPGTTSAASTRSALGMLALLALHTPTLFAALASPRGIAESRIWDPRRRWGMVLAGLAVPAVTGAIAWNLTRQTLRRFDEWVGRPCRSREPPPDAAGPTGDSAPRV